MTKCFQTCLQYNMNRFYQKNDNAKNLSILALLVAELSLFIISTTRWRFLSCLIEFLLKIRLALRRMME